MGRSVQSFSALFGALWRRKQRQTDWAGASQTSSWGRGRCVIDIEGKKRIKQFTVRFCFTYVHRVLMVDINAEKFFGAQ